MLEDHAKIAALIHQAGEIAGRKKLQKMVYILQKIGFPFHETYRFHFYGPYSEELTMQLEELCDFGFILEKQTETSGEHYYCYRLTEEGETFLAHTKQLPYIKSIAEKLNAETAAFLELVSILLYFDRLPRKSAIEKAQVIGKDYNQTDMQRAYTFIAALYANKPVGLSL
ncbi:YwgA family protein [Sporolactobacillus putidus]|uniref:YwgA family protein n=1 Tax=Sporolactobacillus putidus TaxID=492735 RepID=A0A917S0K7_9BACL|nr:hypothetical protein [Sporolactobacillus putidus]GGL50116.1 hypothetical protein GCM10007968_12880 [Sporolactobacillus putidus]